MKWQYGMRFLSDNSEAWRWCGRTSQQRAEAEIARCSALYPNDAFRLVRRSVDEGGRPVGASEILAS